MKLLKSLPLCRAALFCMIVTTCIYADTLTIDEFGTYERFRRAIGDSTVAVDFSGAWSGQTPETIEARVIAWDTDFVIIPWTQATLSSLGDSGTYSGTFDMPEGGWYAVEVRSYDQANSVIATTKSSNKWRVKTYFENYQVIQRDIGGNSAEVTVSGKYAGDPDAIQARVVDHGTNTAVVDWTTLTSSLSGGEFSGTLTVPQGGWYNIQVRSRSSSGDILAEDKDTNKWGVGINVLCIGQSNMIGAGDPPFTTANDLAACWSNEDDWEHLEDPYEHGGVWLEEVDIFWVAEGQGASLVPSLANVLCEEYDIPVGFVPASKGSSPLHQYPPDTVRFDLNWERYYVDVTRDYWVKRNASDPDDITTLYGNSLYNANNASGVELIVWWQGETDAERRLSGTEYQEDLQTLIANYRTDLHAGIPFFLCQLGVGSGQHASDSSIAGIRKAQHDSDNGEDIFLAAVTADFPLKEGNDWHFDTETYDAVGKRIGNAVKYYYGDASFYRGPEIASAKFSDNRRTIDIALTHRGGSDFSPSNGITGFEVFDDGHPVAVLSAIRHDASTLRLTLSGPVMGAGTVRYLYGRYPDNRRPVRDNSPLELPLEPTTGPVHIENPSMIRVTSPRGGEVWTQGKAHEIAWTSWGAVGEVKIEVSTNNGTTWSVLSSSKSNTGIYPWTPSSSASSHCLVRISDASGGSPQGQSKTVFTIADQPRSSSTITLSNYTVDENLSPGSLIGRLATNGQEGDAYTYTLVDGDGFDDNERFTIRETSLYLAASLDYEFKDVYSIRIRSKDNTTSDIAAEEALYVMVNNVDDIALIYPPELNSGTLELSRDTTLNFNVRVRDYASSSDPLTGWLLDGEEVSMPLAIAEAGSQALTFFAKEGSADTTKQSWKIIGNNRVVQPGDTVFVIVPSNSTLHFSDPDGLTITLTVQSDLLAGKLFAFAFLETASLPIQPKSYCAFYIDHPGTIGRYYTRIDLPTAQGFTLEKAFGHFNTSDCTLKRMYKPAIDSIDSTMYYTTRHYGAYAIVDTNIFYYPDSIVLDPCAPVAVTPTPGRETLSKPLLRAYPNPVTTTATLEIGIPAMLEGHNMRLDVYDARGRLIATPAQGKARKGIQLIQWNVVDDSRQACASTMYFFRLEIDNRVMIRRCMVAR
ncbi:MAG: hypothetical protein GF401_01350 [Chitinivibrionales bacterium]|nr:hypothetical protein [Chitinivibrionales bacterium]